MQIYEKISKSAKASIGTIRNVLFFVHAHADSDFANLDIFSIFAELYLFLTR
jgi:hypothetical protein